MKEKLRQYFETEKVYIKAGLRNEANIEQVNKICQYAMQRALGAIDIAQMCGLDYDTAEKMFYNYCHELERMKPDEMR